MMGPAYLIDLDGTLYAGARALPGAALDLLVLLLGRPRTVEAGCANHHLKGIIEVEDTLEAYLDFGGASALLYATTACCVNAPVLLEVICDNMTLRMEGDTLTVRTPAGERTECFARAAAPGKNYWGTSHAAYIADFYRSVRAGAPAPVGLPEVDATVEALLALYRSARESHRPEVVPAR